MRCHCISRVPSTDPKHQAGLVLLGGCKASQEPLSCKLALISALTFALHQTHLHAPLCRDGMIATFTYHQCTIANTTHKLHWHACTRGHRHACAPVVLPHAFTRWCGCAMGTSIGPKQAVAHVIMPVMSVGNLSKKIAAKMGVQGCREDGLLEAPGPYW